MKKVQLKKIQLKNFKGLKNFTCNFNAATTTRIYGDNATGKSTVFDAFTWLLFGKDSKGKTDFSIKTFDRVNNVIHKLEHEVEGTFSVNNEIMILHRVLREKWVTKRGNSEPELTGHETTFFWNNVPLKAGEYQKKVDDIILEDTFKLLTSPFYFNSLKWQDRRKILTGVAGDVKDTDALEKITTLQNKQEIFALNNILNSSKSLDEYKKELLSKKKKLKNELKLIPARIDELIHNTPEVHDWEKIETKIEVLKKEIANIDEQLQDVSKISKNYFKKVQNRQNEIHKLKSQISNKEFQGSKNFKRQLDEKTEAIATAKNAIEKINNRIFENAEETKRLRNRIKSYKKEQDLLRLKWTEENQKSLTIAEDIFICPTCKQTLPEDNIKSRKTIMLQNFNITKQKKLKNIQIEGKAITPRIQELNNRIQEFETINHQEQIEKYEATIRKWNNVHLKSVQTILENDADYNELKKQLKTFELATEIKKPTLNDNSNLKIRKAELQNYIDDLKKKLNLREQIGASQKRKSELLKKEKNYAQKISELEQTEFTIEEFTRAKVDMLDCKINTLFAGVKFRLFENQLNGGLVECCDTLINGVPWADANNAGRINAGIAIINVLSKHYGQIAPIWIDNAESISKIRDTQAQKIELYVSNIDKTLRIA